MIHTLDHRDFDYFVCFGSCIHSFYLLLIELISNINYLMPISTRIVFKAIKLRLSDFYTSQVNQEFSNLVQKKFEVYSLFN
jgi:hypothetical protein